MSSWRLVLLISATAAIIVTGLRWAFADFLLDRFGSGPADRSWRYGAGAPPEPVDSAGR